MKISLMNIHMHIFISECAPLNFLKSQKSILAKALAPILKTLMEKPINRTRIWLAEKVSATIFNENSKINRKLSFAAISSKRSQADVFHHALKNIRKKDKEGKLAVMTMNFDYMDTKPPIINFATQLNEIITLKHFFPDNIYPFIGADPRHESGESLVNFIQNYFNQGVYSPKEKKIIPYGSGIKLYPAYGFFPFDPRLDELYRYAEEHEIPLMYHCTRVGTQYVGNKLRNILPKKPDMIMPTENSSSYMDANDAKQDIYARIDRYYKAGKVNNSQIGLNDLACDLFSHPMNYVPIMCKYPKLKICLAHMGGSSEVKFMYRYIDKKDSRYKSYSKAFELDLLNWSELIIILMKKYDHLYTDISSTIDKTGTTPLTQNILKWLEDTDKNGNPLSKRIMFGTDFFMTELNVEEGKLYDYLKEQYIDFYDDMTKTSIQSYL